MRVLLISSLLCLTVGSAMVGCGSQRAVFDRMVSEDVLGESGLQYYWQLKVEMDSGEQIAIDRRGEARMWLLDENLYLLTTKNRLIALDAARGLLKWYYTVAPTTQRVYPPCHAPSSTISEQLPGIAGVLDQDAVEMREPFKPVVINTQDRIVVLNRDTGELVRNIHLPEMAMNTGGDTDGINFYVADVAGLYYGISLQNAIPLWSRSTGGMVLSPVEYHNDTVYVAGMNEKVYATTTGLQPTQAWSRTLTGPVTAPFSVSDKGCFIPCEDNRLYALSPLTGQILPGWDQPFIAQGPMRTAPTVGDDTIFQYAQNDKFYAINLTNGQRRWERPAPTEALAVIGSMAYLRDIQSNTLIIVDKILGQPDPEQPAVPLTAMDRFVANAAVPAIYAANANGSVVCIRHADAGRLRLQDLIEQ